VKEVLKLRHHLAYRDDASLFIVIKMDIVLHRINLCGWFVLFTMTALSQVKPTKASNLRRLIPVVFTVI
jgi:hypothetical protein